MQLIPGWRRAWRLWSVRASAIGAMLSTLAVAAPDVIGAVWQQLPPHVLARLPVNVTMVVPILLFAGSAIARVLQQRSLSDDQ